MDMLDKAIALYDTSSELYVVAKEDRHDLQEAQQLELLAKSHRHTIRPGMEKTIEAERERRRRGSSRSSLQRNFSSSSLTSLGSLGRSIANLNISSH